MELASSEYAGNTAYDELLDRNLQPRLAARPLFDYLNSLDESEPPHPPITSLYPEGSSAFK